MSRGRCRGSRGQARRRGAPWQRLLLRVELCRRRPAFTCGCESGRPLGRGCHSNGHPGVLSTGRSPGPSLRPRAWPPPRSCPSGCPAPSATGCSGRAPRPGPLGLPPAVPVSAGAGRQSVHVALSALLVTHGGFACERELPCSLARPAFGVSEGWGAGCPSPASWGCWLEGLPPPRLGAVIEGVLGERLCSHVQAPYQGSLADLGWG